MLECQLPTSYMTLQLALQCQASSVLYMNKEKSESNQGLNLGLSNTSQMLLPLIKPPGLLGINIGAENIVTSVVILIVHKSILY